MPLWDYECVVCGAEESDVVMWPGDAAPVCSACDAGAMRRRPAMVNVTGVAARPLPPLSASSGFWTPDRVADMRDRGVAGMKDGLRDGLRRSGATRDQATELAGRAADNAERLADAQRAAIDSETTEQRKIRRSIEGS